MGLPICVDVFSAVADPVRRDLLRTLARGSARVVDLAAEHPVSRPAVSKHLRVLTEAGLVEADVRGREHHYRMRPEPLAEVRALLDDLVPVAARPPVPESAASSATAPTCSSSPGPSTRRRRTSGPR